MTEYRGWTIELLERRAFAQEHRARRDDGCVLYHLRRPWAHPQGVTCLVLEPLDFMRRLAALIPAPPMPPAAPAALQAADSAAQGTAAMAVLAHISDSPVVAKILPHLRLPTVPPTLVPARGSTTAQVWGLVPPRHADPDDPAGEALDLIHSSRLYRGRDPDSVDAPLVARPLP